MEVCCSDTKQDAKLLQLTLHYKVQCTKLNHADHQNNAISILLYMSIIYLDWSFIMHQHLENYKDVLIFYLVLRINYFPQKDPKKICAFAVSMLKLTAGIVQLFYVCQFITHQPCTVYYPENPLQISRKKKKQIQHCVYSLLQKDWVQPSANERVEPTPGWW